MFRLFYSLAEIVPQSEVFWDYSKPPNSVALAGMFFLLILCVGVVIDLGLVVYFLKRPPRVPSWHEDLTARALPGRLILILFFILVAFYLGCSLAYEVFFPNEQELKPYALIFQGLFFHIPALLVLSGVFRHRRKSGRGQPGVSWRWAPAMLGLSVLLYLAAIPILWFYSMLYQVLLYQFGFNFYLQKVAEVFLTPVPALERIVIYFTAIVLAPVFEEVVFRGVLLPWMVRRTGFWPGIAIVSAVFAAMHLHLPSFLPLFLLSAMFCVAYARTRSLLVPIGMHACFNAVTVILLTLTGG
jgi:membrane protease YdiL (CAAX protease family)